MKRALLLWVSLMLFAVQSAEGHGVAAAAAAMPEASASSAPSKPARDSTLDLVSALDAYQSASPGDQGRALAALVAAAKSRQDVLTGLVATDPAEVLRVVLPASIRSRFPAQAAQFVEQDVDQDGDLEVIHVDYTDHSLDHIDYWLKTPKGRTAMYFAADAPTLLSGTKVHVHGKQVGDVLALDSGSNVTVLAAAALPNTLGAQKTIVILVSFADDTTTPFSQSTASSTVFTTTSNYDYETSYQQTTLSGDVTPWLKISLLSTATGCPYSTIASQAEQAATGAGYTLSNYSRKVYAFYSMGSCGWWGLGSVGGNPSQAWVQSKYGFTLPVIGHEMGHNLGLYHSHSLDCGAVSLDANLANCTTSEYGDIFDMMGSSNTTPHYNAFQKERIGWLNAGVSPPLTTVTSAGTYSITPMENPRDASSRALKIARGGSCPSSTNDWFYVELRQAKGFDGFLSSNTNMQTGVVIHKVTNGDPNSSYLLDMTAATTSWSDPALVAPLVFQDPVTGLTIQPVSVGSVGATINVGFGAATCTRAAPTVSLAPNGTVWTSDGKSVSYSVTVKNNDGCGCTASSYNVAATAPSGWSSAGGTTAFISPGASASAGVVVTTSSTAPNGFYTVPVNATNPVASTSTATVNGTVAVLSSIAASVTTDKTTYTRPQKRNQTVYAKITTQASDTGGNPVSGATVTTTVTDPSGAQTKYSGTTSSTGTFVASFPIKQRGTLIGSYSVNSVTTMGSATGSATASFVVN